MASRDRYDIDLACDACGIKGSARVSENDYAFMRRLDFSVDRIDPEFVVVSEGDNLLSTKFACAKCGKPAR